MKKADWRTLIDKFQERERASESVWVNSRGGGNHEQKWSKYTPAQNRRWLMIQLENAGVFSEKELGS